MSAFTLLIVVVITPGCLEILCIDLMYNDRPPAPPVAMRRLHRRYRDLCPRWAVLTRPEKPYSSFIRKIAKLLASA